MEHDAVCKNRADLEGLKKGVSLSITSYLPIFVFPPSLSHILRVIPPHQLSSDFFGLLPVNIRHYLTICSSS